MNINRFNTQFKQGKMVSPIRPINLYETQFSREPDNHAGKLPESSIFSGSMSASYSTINPAISRIESNPFYHGQYHGYVSRDTRHDMN